MVENSPTGAVKSATRTLDVLELLVGQARPMAAGEIAGALAIPVSSLSYLLSTLVERGYLDRDGRAYAAGPALARLQPRTRAPTLVERAGPLVRMLGSELNETASFFVPRKFEIEAIASEIGHHALRYTVAVGQRAPMHSFSAGKALLAMLGPDDFEDYLLTTPRQAFTPGTLTEEAALRADIAATRRTGIARTRDEHTIGIFGIGRAATVRGEPAGAFSVAIPSVRYTQDVDDRTVRLLIQACERLDR